MTHSQIKNHVLVHISNLKMLGKKYGDVRLFKFIVELTGSEAAAKEFMKNENYPSWLVNKIPKRIEREKRRYELLKLNTATIIQKGL